MCDVRNNYVALLVQPDVYIASCSQEWVWIQEGIALSFEYSITESSLKEPLAYPNGIVIETLIVANNLLCRCLPINHNLSWRALIVRK